MGKGTGVTPRVGIVVPTLGNRSKFLAECLKSISLAGEAHVCIVAPSGFASSAQFDVNFVDQIVEDPNQGLAAAINLGINSLPQDIDFVNWLGDDDLLEPGSLSDSIKILKNNSNVALVYGSCNYIDPTGRIVWFNKSGKWASKILRFGPDLIPQPGCLIRRSAFEKVGGLDLCLDWAFDFDLFLKLKTVGRLHYLNKTLANFRWHPTSLSVEFREKSVAEASKVRVKHLPKILQPASKLWEIPIRKATLFAGTRITQKAGRLIP